MVFYKKEHDNKGSNRNRGQPQQGQEEEILEPLIDHPCRPGDLMRHGDFTPQPTNPIYDHTPVPELWAFTPQVGDFYTSRPPPFRPFLALGSTSRYINTTAAFTAAATGPPSDRLRLTADQRRYLKENGGCFRCGNLGHFSRNCVTCMECGKASHHAPDCTQYVRPAGRQVTTNHLLGPFPPHPAAEEEAELPQAFVLAMELGAEGASVRYTPSRGNFQGNRQDSHQSKRRGNTTAQAAQPLQGRSPAAAAATAATTPAGDAGNTAVAAIEFTTQGSVASPPGLRALRRDDLDTAWIKYRPPKKR